MKTTSGLIRATLSLQQLDRQLLNFLGQLFAGDFAFAKGQRLGGQRRILPGPVGGGGQLRGLRRILAAVVALPVPGGV